MGEETVVFEGDDETSFGDFGFTGGRLECEDCSGVVTELDGMDVASDAEESSPGAGAVSVDGIEEAEVVG